MLAHKLELTRAEKYVHNFMMDNHLTKRVSSVSSRELSGDENKCCGTSACRRNAEMKTHFTVMLPLRCLDVAKGIGQQLRSTPIPMTT